MQKSELWCCDTWVVLMGSRTGPTPPASPRDFAPWVLEALTSLSSRREPHAKGGRGLQLAWNLGGTRRKAAKRVLRGLL